MILTKELCRQSRDWPWQWKPELSPGESKKKLWWWAVGKDQALQGKQGSTATGRKHAPRHPVLVAGWPTTPFRHVGCHPHPNQQGSQLPRRKAKNGGSRMLSFSLSEVQAAPGSSTLTPLTGQKTHREVKSSHNSAWHEYQQVQWISKA